MRIRGILFFLVSILAGEAWSHPLDLGYMPIKVQGNQMEISLELNPVAAKNFAKLSQSPGSPEEVLTAQKSLIDSTLAQTEVYSEKSLCSWSETAAVFISDQQIKISGVVTCPQLSARGFRLHLAFLSRAPATFQLIGKIETPEGEHSFIADPLNPEVEISPASAEEYGFLKFIKMGIEHIGASSNQWQDDTGFHLPDGIDHILFLLALILGGGGLWQILKTATGFTLGHSITLALAALGIVRLPASIIEPAIALSIVFVAIEAFFSIGKKNRWKIAALFGLVHGFGFASALRELNLDSHSVLKALVGFNVGVELGQALIILVILPFLFFISKSPVLYRYFVKISAALIVLAGAYWFVIRILGH